jgi:AcrR family transcriptional regulator
VAAHLSVTSYNRHFGTTRILGVAEVVRAPTAGLRGRKKDRTRAMLIDAAIELCKRQGFERTTVEQIAAVADVSPRTFSRYFATKEDVILALNADLVDAIAARLVRQPAELSELDALRAAQIDMVRATASAPPGGLTTERLITTARIVASSPALRMAAGEYRRRAMTVALANWMGAGVVDERRVRLAGAAWSAIMLLVVEDFGPDTDWQSMTGDLLVARLDDTFTQFVELIRESRQLRPE